jgi:ribonuclease BN (tRNA processing enzyme)
VSVAECRDKGHVHLDEVCERAHLFENEAILVTHLSQRYTPDEARRILARRLPPALHERVVPLLPEPAPRGT